MIVGPVLILAQMNGNVHHNYVIWQMEILLVHAKPVLLTHNVVRLTIAILKALVKIKIHSVVYMAVGKCAQHATQQQIHVS